METKTAIVGGGGNSHISFDENTNEVGYHGRNVVTDNPGVGDILCYDENRKYKFIVLDTYHAGTFPAAWETLGVVTLRKGNKVTVCSKHNAYKKFMEVFPYIVTGYMLDGTEHMATLKLHGSDTFEFKYTANTDNEFVEALKSFLIEHGFSDWSAYIMDGKVILQYDNYTSMESPETSQADGLDLIAKQEFDFSERTKGVLRKYGDYNNVIWHVARAKEYYINDLDITNYNPVSEVTRMPVLPVCWPAFAGISQYRDKDYCFWLRQRYCKDPDKPTKEEWEKLIEDMTAVIPAMTGGASRRQCELQTAAAEKLKDIEYATPDGARKKLYPGYAYCAEFLNGKGRLPTVSEFIEAFGNITYGLSGVTREQSDPINRSLFAIGGNAVRCTSGFAISSQNVTGTAWQMANVAFMAGMSAHGEITSLPFASLELPL